MAALVLVPDKEQGSGTESAPDWALGSDREPGSGTESARHSSLSERAGRKRQTGLSEEWQ